MNIFFEYLYRDAANYKNWGSVIFHNPGNLREIIIADSIKSMLIDEIYFSASKVDVPNLYFPQYIEELDHGWHEFFLCQSTNEPANDKSGRNIEDFIVALRSMYEDERRLWMV